MGRELSFGVGSPQAGVRQQNGAPVQHVESLGAWAQTEATRRPSVKLSGRHSTPC